MFMFSSRNKKILTPCEKPNYLFGWMVFCLLTGEKEVKVKSPNLIVRAKEEFEAIMHHKKSDSHHKEAEGLKTNNSKKNASSDGVRAPNVLQRAKEEFEAIAHVLHHKKDSPTHGKRDETKVAKSKDKQEIPGSPQAEKKAKKVNIFVRAKEEIDAIIHHEKSPHRHNKETHGMSDDIDENTPNNEVKGPNVFERVKEEIDAIIHHEKSPHRHHKETHGMSNDIDENTPNNEVKGPNVFERVKEEIEAVVQAIHPKKET